MQKPVFGTFGIFRLLLSCFVVLAHVDSTNYYYFGIHAVYLFYLLSGYVVSYAFTYQYSHFENGLSKFYANRLIRVYPLYWVAVLLSAVMLLIYPQSGLRMDSRLFLIDPFESSNNLANWFYNITLTGTAGISGDLLNPSLAPPSWSVGVELIYWLMLPACLYFRKLRLCIFAFAALWTASFLIVQPNMATWFKMWYRSPLSGLFPFMLGVYLFYARQRLTTKSTRMLGLVIASVYFSYLIYGSSWGLDMQFEGFFLSLLPGLLVIYYLSCIDSRKLPRRFVEVDKLLGGMAYGVLLFHQPVAALVYVYMPYITYSDLFTVTLMLTMLFSVVTDLLVERPVERLRLKLKH